MPRRHQSPDPHHPSGEDSVTEGVVSSLFGREAVLAGVVRDRTPLCIVAGDSGMGKTTLLERASREPALGFASSPHRILQSEPFEHALVVALADALQGLARQRSRARELAESLSTALGAVRDTALSDVPDIVVSALLTSLLPGLGDPVASAFKALRKRLKGGGANELAARATETVSPLVVHTLTAILTEAGALASPEMISLVLDNGEGGTAADRRLLADIADALPPGTRIILGYRTGDLTSDDSLRDLTRRAERAVVVELGPLDESAVEEWLAAESIVGADPERVLALTEGNPLLIGDVMLRLRAEETVTQLPPTNTFAALTESSWNSLSAPAQRAARQLAVFDEPLPPEDVLNLLNVDVAGWAQLLAELRRARIVVDRADGAGDVHQLRRHVILEQLLEPFELPHLYADAAAIVERLLERTGDLAWLAQYSTLVERADPLRAEDGLLDAICEASDDELRVLASVMELQSTHAVDDDGVAYYAAAIWHLEGAGAGVLSRLVVSGLVLELGGDEEVTYIDATTGHTEVRRAAPAYAPVSFEPKQYLLFLGRSVRRLGRVPIDGVALAQAAWFSEVETVAFNLQPGYALNHELLRAWIEFGPGPALIVKGRYSAIPLCGVFWFESEAERDRAVEHVRPQELLHGPLDVDVLMRLPMRRVPTLRWLRAVFTPARTPELLSRVSDAAPSRWFWTAENAARVVTEDGETADGTEGGADDEPEPATVDPEVFLDGNYWAALAQMPGTGQTAGEALALRAALDRAVWTRCDDAERFVYELRPSLSWHYAEGGDGYVELAVAGAGEGVVRHPSLPSGSDVAGRTAIRRQLSLDYLSAELIVRNPSEPPGRVDAVINRVSEYAYAARVANEGQHLLTLSLAPEQLAATIADGIRGWYEDARYLEQELASLWTPPARPSLPPRVLVAIALEQPGAEHPGWHSTALCAVTNAASADVEVEVRFVDRPEEDDDAGCVAEYLEELLERDLLADYDDYEEEEEDTLADDDYEEEDGDILADDDNQEEEGGARYGCGLPFYTVPDGEFDVLFPEDVGHLEMSDLAGGLLAPVVAMLLGHDWWDLSFSW